MGISAQEIYDSIYKSYNIANTFENWKEYRERITDFIIKHTIPGKRIAIFGVGRADDIDLKRLYEHLGNVTLIDIRKEDMDEAVIKYDLQNKHGVTIKCMDLIGITKEDYLDIINICRNDLKRMKQFFSPLSTAPKIVAKMHEIYGRINAEQVDFGQEHFDYTVMIGVHSQLNAFIENIWRYFLLATKKTDNKVAECAQEENHILMPRINEALLNITDEIAFVGLELFENGRDCAVQGAIQAGMDIGRRTEEKEIINDICWRDVWPLKKDVSYSMVIFKLEKVTKK